MTREVYEETGLDIKQKSLVAVLLYELTFNRQSVPFVSYIFSFQVDTPVIKPVDENEGITGFKWIPASELANIARQLETSPGEWLIWGQFRALAHKILVDKVDIDPNGKVLSGDGASYHKVKFKIIALKPIVNEIVEGEIVEIATFGVFVRIGPLDALLHISQVMNDFVTVDPTQGIVIGKETNRVLRVGDTVRVRIVAVSPPRGVSVGKIGLTSRQPFLGKLEWIEEETKKAKGEEKVREKKEEKLNEK